MSDIEKIRNELERRIALFSSLSENTVNPNRLDEDKQLLSFLDTVDLEEEPVLKGFDEAYINEKIAKASKTWEGVDVDKYMDEVRGREPDKNLVEEVKRYYSDNFAYISSDQPTLSILTNIARHFAEWGAEHLKK